MVGKYACSKYAIYGEIIKSGAMMGAEIFKYRENTMLSVAVHWKLLRIHEHTTF